MIRDLFMPLAEGLFWLMNGEPLINTWWFFVWVIGGAVLMCVPFWFAISVGRNRIRSLPALVFVVSFFPMLLLIVSPGILQMDLMQECQTVTAELTVDGKVTELPIRQCRVKTNFYDTEYGEWKTHHTSG